LYQHAADFALSIGGVNESDRTLPEIRNNAVAIKPRFEEQQFKVCDRERYNEMIKKWQEDEDTPKEEAPKQYGGKLLWKKLQPVKKGGHQNQQRAKNLQSCGFLKAEAAELVGQFFAGDVIETGRSFAWIHCPELADAFNRRYVFLEQEALRDSGRSRMTLSTGMRAHFTLRVDCHGNPIAQDVGMHAPGLEADQRRSLLEAAADEFELRKEQLANEVPQGASEELESFARDSSLLDTAAKAQFREEALKRLEAGDAGTEDVSAG